MDERKIISKIKGKGKGWYYKLKCLKCDRIFDIQGYKFNEGKGKYCSLECANTSQRRIKNLKKALPNRYGKKNSNWQGGKSPFYQYQKFRKTHCELCNSFKNGGQEKKKLAVHHKDGNRNNNAPENLITLCDRCHKIVHTYIMK